MNVFNLFRIVVNVDVRDSSSRSCEEDDALEVFSFVFSVVVVFVLF